MSRTVYKHIAFALLVLNAALGIVIWKVAWHATYAQWDVRDARLAIKHIESMRHQALRSSAREAALYLKDIAEHYSHWHWRRPDLHLGELVEAQRQSACQDILDFLHRVSGKDFGNEPEKWIEALKLEKNQ